MRPDGRENDQLRPVSIQRNFTKYAEGSALIDVGDTRIICNASVEERVPGFLEGQGKGWITAEYSMLPRSTETRSVREVSRGRAAGRTHEIQRLIGRSLRAVVDLTLLGERTIWLDCDVIQADGGTRTASVTGAFVALHDAVDRLRQQEQLESWPIREFVAAVSVGLLAGQPVLDLCYTEDSCADVDMNIVMTENRRLIEVQGTAEARPFDRDVLDTLLDLGERGIMDLISIQKDALRSSIRSGEPLSSPQSL